MSVTIDISVTQDTATAKLEELGRWTGDPETLLMYAAHEIKDFVQAYHAEFDGRWRGDHYMSGPRSGQFEVSVADSWQEPIMVDPSTAMVVNTHPFLSHKITGGTITPKNAKMLTIPLVPEAKGVSAREFSEALFIPKGKRILAMHGPGGEIIPIYALVASVDQAPWPGAMPPQEELQAIFDQVFEVKFAEMAGV